MKSFACGDVVPGCEARWVCTDEQEVLREVARHAAEVHGLTEVPDNVVMAVRAAIVDVPA
jgi:predicted small metal-binding protein